MLIFILTQIRAHFHITGHAYNGLSNNQNELKNNTPTYLNNTANDLFSNNLTNSFSSNGTITDNQSNMSTPLHYHLRPSIYIRRIPIFFSSLDENSLDEESTPQNNNDQEDSKKSSNHKESFFKKIKRNMHLFYESLSITKILCYSLVAVIFTLLGYHLRKREERSNYVRLPNDA